MRKLVISLIFGVSIISCQPFGLSTRKGEQTAAGDSEKKQGRIKALGGVLALRNFREINATMAHLTGANEYDTDRAERTETLLRDGSETWSKGQKYLLLHGYFDRTVRGVLPQKNSVNGFSGPAQAGIFKLASYYCYEMVFRSDLYKKLTKRGFKFTKPSSLTPAMRTEVATSLIEKFWGENLAILPDKDMAVAEVKKLMDEMEAMIGELPQSSTVFDIRPQIASSAYPLLVGACTAVLASAPVIFY